MLRPTRRIGPVQRRIDGQKVRQEATLSVDKIVDPFDDDRPPFVRLDGEGRLVARPRVGGRSVTPNSGRWQA